MKCPVCYTENNMIMRDAGVKCIRKCMNCSCLFQTPSMRVIGMGDYGKEVPHDKVQAKDN